MNPVLAVLSVIFPVIWGSSARHLAITSSWSDEANYRQNVWYLLGVNLKLCAREDRPVDHVPCQ